MDRTIELRKLPPGPTCKLVQMLEASQSWKHLMSIVPKNDSLDPRMSKYTTEHIKLIEHAGDMQRRPCSEIFLEEWGTSGQVRPNLETLLQLLIKAELFRAAEYVAMDLLNENIPERPATGPSASVDVSDTTIETLVPTCPDMEQSDSIQHRQYDTTERLLQLQETILIGKLDLSSRPTLEEASLPLDTKLPHYAFHDLERFTDNFCDIPVSSLNGRKLGTGAFGSVYLAIFPLHEKVAVKRLNKDAVNIERQFRNEVEALSKFHHENLLPLLGYCCDGPSYCLIYEYMSNGSLQERLAEKSKVLPWRLRLNIGLGTARGILHLHSAYDKPLIHRDIKTANILLDQHCTPKLGDFGLVKLGANGLQTQSVAFTTTVLGTSAYMAPEAFRGDISVKIDTFSFGVVVLELLTSLSPYDENRQGVDLVTHVEEICEDSISPLLDEVAGNWGNLEVANSLYKLALDCLEEKRHRPSMGDVVLRLMHIVGALS